MGKKKNFWKKNNISRNEKRYFFVFLIFIIFLPIALTNDYFYIKDFSKTGDIGDTIGGITAPFLSLLGSILVYIAFKEQIKANKLIQKQFKIQQFESQFYEMLRLHKENVNEMKAVDSIKDKTQIEGRGVFEKMTLEFSELLSKLNFGNSTLTHNDFVNCYHIFFWGVKIYPRLNLTEHQKKSNPWENLDNHYSRIRNFGNYKGFSASLGHYFRHLFMMVKFVVNNDLIKDYKEKMKYLKIIRAQLSNYEQIMLFYNWLAKGYGEAWEEENDDGNHFFTEYKMIHNLWHTELYNNNFFYSKVNDLINNYNKNYKKETPLFEFQGNDFDYKIQLINENESLSESFKESD